jgi:hypothetical protein
VAARQTKVASKVVGLMLVGILAEGRATAKTFSTAVSVKKDADAPGRTTLLL